MSHWINTQCEQAPVLQTPTAYLPRRRAVVLEERAQRQEGPRQGGVVPEARREEVDVVVDGPFVQGEGWQAVQQLPQQRGGLGADLLVCFEGRGGFSGGARARARACCHILARASRPSQDVNTHLAVLAR